MKRSEMRRLLAGFLSTIYETDKHPMDQLERAGMVLDMLEECGLKPPLTKRCPVLLTTEHVWQKEEENEL